MALALVPLALSLLLQPTPNATVGPDTAYAGMGRRDPFSRPQAAHPTACAGDLSCLSIDAAEIRGTVRTPKGWAALLTSGARSYLVRPGDLLLDGSVTEVGEIHVAFRQLVPDPLAVAPSRTVVKSLRTLAARQP